MIEKVSVNCNAAKILSAQHVLAAPLAKVLGRDAGTLDSKSWTDFDPDPWVFKADDGTSLGQVEEISLALTRTALNRPPYFDLRSVLAFNKKSLGWRCTSNCSSHLLTIQLKDRNGAVIYSYRITLTTEPATECELVIACSDNGVPYSHSRSIEVDIYNDVTAVSLVKNGGTWYQC